MKRNCSLFVLICLSALTVFTACNQRFPGYKKTADGLYYKFHEQNTSEPQPKPTDFLRVAMACYLNDELYYDWQESQTGVYSQLTMPKFAGDLQEAYAMMHLGDSASFYVKADSIAVLYYDQDPKAVDLKPEDYFRYEVKLLEIISQKEFQANIDQLKKKMINESKEALQNYIAENNITVEPLESGIYIIPMEKGKGRCPEKGELVELDFDAKLLNGKTIGSTINTDKKLSFVLGDGSVIPGWEEIVPRMHLGERITAVIPFEMAYGDHDVSGIPSYANLVYDIKLLKITTVEEQEKQAEEALKQMKLDSETAFQAYVKDNNIVDHTETGLYYTKSLVTDGQPVTPGKTARIKFVASYLDGTLLGNSDDLGEYYDFVVGKGRVVKGLDEGVGLMRVGERARFVLPYTLAYGENSHDDIPPYSNLVFDVELLDVLSK